MKKLKQILQKLKDFAKNSTYQTLRPSSVPKWFPKKPDLELKNVILFIRRRIQSQ